MKRKPQSVLLAGLLAVSLAACSYLPWRNTSGISLSPTPSVASTASRSTDSAPASASVTATANEKTNASGGANNPQQP